VLAHQFNDDVDDHDYYDYDLRKQERRSNLVENVIKVKVKVPRNRPEGPEGVRVIAILFADLGARRRWVVSTTPRPQKMS
jgi:hypothetical protein